MKQLLKNEKNVQPGDLYLILENGTEVSLFSKENKNVELSKLRITRFSKIKFESKYLTIWFPPPDNKPEMVSLGGPAEVDQK